jgi:hypothetical protein
MVMAAMHSSDVPPFVESSSTRSKILWFALAGWLRLLSTRQGGLPRDTNKANVWKEFTEFWMTAASAGAALKFER